MSGFFDLWIGRRLRGLISFVIIYKHNRPYLYLLALLNGGSGAVIIN